VLGHFLHDQDPRGCIGISRTECCGAAGNTESRDQNIHFIMPLRYGSGTSHHSPRVISNADRYGRKPQYSTNAASNPIELVTHAIDADNIFSSTKT
jgi:hypothetical protein